MYNEDQHPFYSNVSTTIKGVSEHRPHFYDYVSKAYQNSPTIPANVFCFTGESIKHSPINVVVILDYSDAQIIKQKISGVVANNNVVISIQGSVVMTNPQIVLRV